VATEPSVVLLICADRDSAARLAAAIQPRGHTVIAAPFGPTAIAKAQGARLIVVDRVEGSDNAVAAVGKVKSAPGLGAIPLLAIAQGDDVNERVQLLESGADDVISRPVDPAELELRLEALLLRTSGRPPVDAAAATHRMERAYTGPRVVAFLSPKGGAGTTTLAVNTAVTLARGGRSVAILDLDLAWGQVATHLNVRPRSSIVDVARDEVALDEPEQLRAYAEDKAGLAVFAAPERPDQSELVGPVQVRRLLASASAAYDTVVVDGGSAFDERTLSLLEMADRVAIVTVPEIPALRAIRSLLEVLSEYQHDTDKRLFVLNHIFSMDLLSAVDVKRALGNVMMVEVPHDPVLFHKAANEGVPVVTSAPKTTTADRLVRLATALAGDPDGDNGDAKRLKLAGLLRRG
jgi:pilus assembly protein CpaE